MKKPHILLITTDEQHRSTLSCFDGIYPCMPNVDRFAGTADVFPNAYTPSPVCLPARCSIMTGLAPHRSGSVSNIFGASLSREYPNLFTCLKAEGYRTALYGKCHFIPVPYPATRGDMTLEYEHFITYYRSLGMDKLCLQDDKNNSLWYYDDYSKDLARRGMLRKIRYEAHQNPENHGCYDFPFDSSMHPDAWVGDRAVEHLCGADPEQPSFTWVSFSGPHYPVDTPREYIDRIDPSKIPPRVFDPDEWADESKYHYRGYHGPGTTEGSGHAQGGAQKNYDEAYWLDWRRRYLGNLLLIDEKIGQILTAAEEKFGENLLVIFTTDHGEMMGNHSLWGKNGALFQDVLRIPLLIRAPGQKSGRVFGQTVSSLELFPTILHAAGAKIPDCDGLPIGEMVARGGRDYVISECEDRVAIVEGRYKLEINRAGMRGRVYREFYDLSIDPHEFVNRYDDPSYGEIIGHLQSILDSQPDLNETVFRPADGADYWLNDGRGAGLAGQRAADC